MDDIIMTRQFLAPNVTPYKILAPLNLAPSSTNPDHSNFTHAFRQTPSLQSLFNNSTTPSIIISILIR
ncbi:hypothetical protein QVD17_36806 [Tagetes erecta]|uniref:Uncharacterized protein n=1 Tax=Tagetes erecta TaxID=13708 RepID=A0AAD8JVC3_TARER|nr:hypothetical protein QVD17_36806 [Tagetes erecta]